jgi:hypothetical protein
MRSKIMRVTLVAAFAVIIANGSAVAEDGVGGSTDFNADGNSRIAAIEQAGEVNQGNIADNAADISENALRISTNEVDIANLMGGGSGVAPGIANAILQDDQGLPPVPANTTAVIVSGSIDAPVDGFVLAIGSLQFSNSTFSGSCNVGVSLGNTLPPHQDLNLRSETGHVSIPATVHGIFSVTAGENSINLLVRSSGDSICGPNDVNLTLVFFPASSAYGPVTSN